MSCEEFLISGVFQVKQTSIAKYIFTPTNKVTLPEGRRSLGRPKGRWEDTIEMDFKETEREVVNCSNLVPDKDG